MTSLDHAKALAAALPPLGDYSRPNEYWIETIQKAMEAYAREQKRLLVGGVKTKLQELSKGESETWGLVSIVFQVLDEQAKV